MQSGMKKQKNCDQRFYTSDPTSSLDLPGEGDSFVESLKSLLKLPFFQETPEPSEVLQEEGADQEDEALSSARLLFEYFMQLPAFQEIAETDEHSPNSYTDDGSGQPENSEQS